MKRFLIGVGWYTIIHFVLTIIGAFIAGFRAGLGATNTEAGAQAGAAAGQAFQTQFGLIVLIAAFVIALVGTLTQILPCTKKEQK